MSDVDTGPLLQLMQKHRIQFGREFVFIGLEVLEELQLGRRFYLAQYLLVFLGVFLQILHDILREIIDFESFPFKVVLELFKDSRVLKIQIKPAIVCEK